MHEKNSNPVTNELLKRTGLIVAISSISIAAADELPKQEIERINPLPAEAIAASSSDVSDQRPPKITSIRPHHNVEPQKYWYATPQELKVVKQLGNTANAKLTYNMAREQPWFTSQQMYCVDKLWYRESKFDKKVSGGIPQAKPASKMASAGKNWMDSATTQIKWGFDYYIEDVYETPCAAWAHSQATGWY